MAEHTHSAPHEAASLSKRLTMLEEAVAGLVATVAEQQGRLSQLQKQAGQAVSVEALGLAPLAVTPSVAAAFAELVACLRTDKKFAYDLGLTARRQEKRRDGPLNGLLQAMIGPPEPESVV